MAAEGRFVPAPAFRALRVFAVDPGLESDLGARVANEAVLQIPWEELSPGPRGEYLEGTGVETAVVFTSLSRDRITSTLAWAVLDGMDLDFRENRFGDREVTDVRHGRAAARPGARPARRGPQRARLGGDTAGGWRADRRPGPVSPTPRLRR